MLKRIRYLKTYRISYIGVERVEGFSYGGWIAVHDIIFENTLYTIRFRFFINQRVNFIPYLFRVIYVSVKKFLII